MTFLKSTFAPRILRNGGRPYLRAAAFASLLAGLPALAMMEPADAPQPQALAPLPTVAEFRARVHADPNVIHARGPYVAAHITLLNAVLVHGQGSPQAAEAEALLVAPRTAWIENVITSYNVEINHHRNQGHDYFDLLAAYPVQSVCTAQ